MTKKHLLAGIVLILCAALPVQAAGTVDGFSLFPSLAGDWGEDDFGTEPSVEEDSFGPSRAKRLSIVIRAGMDLSNIWGHDWQDAIDSGVDDPLKIGGAGDVSFAVSVMKVLSIQIGLGYASRGHWTEIDSGGFQIETSTLFHYFDIPLCAVFRIPTNSIVTPRVLMGINLGLMLGATYESEMTFLGTTTTDHGDVDDVKPIDFALLFGLGVEFKVRSKISILVDARYTVSLTPYFDDPDTDGDFKHEFYAITVGILFSFA